MSTDTRGTLYISSADGRVVRIARGVAHQMARVAAGGICVSSHGDVFVAQPGDHRVQRICPGGAVTTVAGAGERGYSGDGGPAGRAQLHTPYDVAVGADGCLYIADVGSYRVRKVDRRGTITTVAGSEAIAAPAASGPVIIAVDPQNRVCFTRAGASGTGRVDVVEAGHLRILAGGGTRVPSVTPMPAREARFLDLRGLAIGVDGSVYCADAALRTVYRTDPYGVLSEMAVLPPTEWVGWKFAYEYPALAASPDGTVYIALRHHGCVLAITRDGRSRVAVARDRSVRWP